MMEFDHEPVRGLPGQLPPGEHILWQGAPDWQAFATSALFTRWIGFYFVALVAVAVASGNLFGALATAATGVIGLSLLALYAWGVAHTTVYTITNKRVVLRIGVALTTCINLPLKRIGSADLRQRSGESGDIALTLAGAHRLGYAVLWPHARPWRIGKPHPMLRALPDATGVAEILARACAAQADIRIADQADALSAPVFRGAPA